MNENDNNAAFVILLSSDAEPGGCVNLGICSVQMIIVWPNP